MSWQIGAGLLAVSWLVVLKVTFILAAAWLAAGALRRRTAAARHAVWTFAVAGALAMPVLVLTMPAWQVQLPLARALIPPALLPDAAPAAGEASTFASVEDAVLAVTHEVVVSSASSATTPARVEGATTSAREEGATTRTTPSAAAIALMLWAAGVFVLLARSVRRRRQLWRLAGTAQRVPAGPLPIRARRIAAEQGLTRPVRLLAGGPGLMPMTFGVFRPTLLLPSDTADWPVSKQDAVLRHELTHIRRRDALTQLVAETATALYWFHPLAWLAARQLRIECEHACDDAVLLAGARASDYAAELLHIATTIRAQPELAAAAMAMARPSHLRVRIEALLDERARAAFVSRIWLVPCATVVLAFVAVLAVLTPAAAARAVIPIAQVPLPPAGEPFLTVDAMVDAATRTPAAAAAPLAVVSGAPDIFQPDVLQPNACLRNDGAHIVGVVTRGDDVTSGSMAQRVVQMRLDDSSLCLMTRGQVAFDAAGTRIESMSPDALVLLESSGPSGARLMEIRSAAGELQHTWYVDGAARAFDDDARQWRDAMIGVLRLHGEIATLRGREASLRGRIASTRGREASLRGQIASIRGQEATMRGQIAAVRGESLSVQGEVMSVRGRETGMRGEIVSIRGRETAMRGEIASLRARISALESEQRASTDAQTRTRIQAEADEVRAAIRDVESRIAEHGANARAAEAERRLAESYRERRNAEIEQRRLEDVDARIREIGNRIAEYGAEARIAEVEQRLADLDVEGDVARIEREIVDLDMERRVRELERQLEPRRHRLRDLLR